MNTYVTNIFSKNTQTYILCFLCVNILSACSVGMALNGKKEPNLNILKQNVSREDIEIQLGNPIKIEQHSNGQIAVTYEVETGKESSPGRAVAHGVMDVLTLGIWEVVGTPVEVFKGDKYILTIVYNKEGRLISASKKAVA